MSHLDEERLSLIALGESPTDGEQVHVETCDECAWELAQLEHAVAVGRSTVVLGELETPPDRVWEAVLADVRASSAVESVNEVSSGATAPEPDAARTSGSAGATSSGRRWGRIMFALAASIAAVVAVVGIWVTVRPPAVAEVAAATLEAFPEHPGAEGEAVVEEAGDGERFVRVELAAAPQPADTYREVWLITADASALISLGVLEGAEGTFAIPEGIDIRDYVLVDVSAEPLDGDPAHSGDSIVRGELSFA